ncbi:MAG: glutathionylspermidine synthase family protein [Polyangiales bacterium]
MSGEYDDFAQEIVRGGVLTDPWMGGAPRFRQEPVFVSPTAARALAKCAEDVAAVYDEACRIVEAAPELLDSFFQLTPFQKAMWASSSPSWHGIARADVFVTADGLQIAELNCDTPTGEAEAVVLGALCAGKHPGARDPNARLEERFVTMMEALVSRRVDEPTKSVGLVYPTELVEDLSLVRLYRGWLEKRGYDVILGSPYNLDEEARLFDHPVSVVLRHYKTDWWGERASAWDDESIEDDRPLAEPFAALLDAELARRAVVINPFGSVLPQNKRMMAFFWEHLHRFGAFAQGVIEKHVPVTARLETLHEEQLRAQRDEWVLKSDYGAEGEEVIVGRYVDDEAWRQSIAHARPGRWIAQRRFDPESTVDGSSVNYGVFLVAGRASGLYARVQAGPTDDRAFSAPALIVG